MYKKEGKTYLADIKEIKAVARWFETRFGLGFHDFEIIESQKKRKRRGRRIQIFGSASMEDPSITLYQEGTTIETLLHELAHTINRDSIVEIEPHGREWAMLFESMMKVWDFNQNDIENHVRKELNPSYADEDEIEDLIDTALDDLIEMNKELTIGEIGKVLARYGINQNKIRHRIIQQLKEEGIKIKG